MSSLSSILGGVVGPPRVLQTIAEDNILPILKPFAKRVSFFVFIEKHCKSMSYFIWDPGLRKPETSFCIPGVSQHRFQIFKKLGVKCNDLFL